MVPTDEVENPQWEQSEEFDDDEEEDYYEDDDLDYDRYNCDDRAIYGVAPSQEQSTNHQPNVQSVKSFQPGKNLMTRYLNRFDQTLVPPSAVSQVISSFGKKANDKRIHKDKSDRATVENALDKRTILVLVSMMRKGLCESVNGCISTGKEANVYHASAPDGKNLAAKVYKTTVLTFKDRERYIEGEFRYLSCLGLKNRKKMVAVWAEKEYRNLCRLHAEGLPCPTPIEKRDNVVLMEFVGDDDMAAPLLKNYKMDVGTACVLYRECLLLMRDMFHKCKLVHADLSEYNLLVHQKRLIIIDVSQAIESMNIKATLFLKEDCLHIKEFFQKKGVAVLTVREMFEFITDPSITEANIDIYLKKMQKMASSRTQLDLEELEQNDKVFMETYVSQTLRLKTDAACVRKIFLKAEEETENDKEAMYAAITGMKADFSGALEAPAILSMSKKKSSAKPAVPEPENKEDVDEEESLDDEDEEGKQTKNFVSSARPRDESPNSRKERQRKFREEKREKRKTKLKKHEKKRIVKCTHK